MHASECRDLLRTGCHIGSSTGRDDISIKPWVFSDQMKRKRTAVVEDLHHQMQKAMGKKAVDCVSIMKSDDDQSPVSLMEADITAIVNARFGDT